MIGVEIGDFYVVGKLPPKLLKALAVIALELHPGFDRTAGLEPGKSKRSCILASLAVRDFLIRVGFPDAEARPVLLVMAASQDGKQLHSLGMGHPDARGDGWNGHLVVTSASARALIDTTLYDCRRPAWPHLAPMIATRLGRRITYQFDGLPAIAGLERNEPDRGYDFHIAWMDNPANVGWRYAPDCKLSRRSKVVETMVQRFGAWEGHDFGLH